MTDLRFLAKGGGKVGNFKAIGTRLRETRQSKGISQEEMAKLLGCTVASVMYWENCMKEPAASYILRICNRLDIDPNYLLCWEIYGPEGKNK